MAGTRLLLQSIVLLELLCLVFWSIHVGFCTPKQQSSTKGFPQLLLPTSVDVLCPWPHLERLMNGDVENEGIKSFERPFHQHNMKLTLVVEDASTLPQWASILDKEFQIPSYLKNMQDVHIATDVQVVPALHRDTPGISEADVQELWKHIATTTKAMDKISVNDVDTHRCIVYVASSLDASAKAIDSEEVCGDNGNCTTVEKAIPVPLLRSYRLNFDETEAWIVIPSTTDLQGALGSVLEEWMVDTTMKSICSHSNNDDNTTYLFWKCIQEHWIGQTLRLHQHARTQDILEESFSLPSIDNQSSLSVPDFQSSVAKWQGSYEHLQLMVLRHTGRKYDPAESAKPQPLRQDFPLEHYAAVFMPLLFPLLVPFLISTIKEYKRWKEKRQEAATNGDNSDSKDKVA